MDSESGESGMEELLRLSKKTSQMEEEFARREKERAAREKKNQEKRQIVSGLKELKISVALDQLQAVATHEIIESVNALKSRPGSRELRDLILDLTAGLEAIVNRKSGAGLDRAALERPVKTLAILIELLFSLE